MESVENFTQFVHPASVVISGPSGVGKSFFVKRVVEHIDKLFSPPIQEILWCCAVQENWSHPRVKFLTEIPDPSTLNPSVNKLLILDDFMEAKSDIQQQISHFFTKYAHHTSTSVIYLVQNLYHQGKYHRTISLNANYFVLFQTRRDATQIHYLGNQLFPQQNKFFKSVVEQVFKNQPYGYLLIDLKTHNEKLRLRSHIFPDEIGVAYVNNR